MDTIVFTFYYVEVLNIAKGKDDLFINDQIRVSELMVIGPSGEQMGIKSKQDAMTLANYAGLDLVLINGNCTPAIGKLMDYNKFRYEKQKKTKEQQKKQREANKSVKEYKLSVTIDVHDFETRRRNAEEYLNKGHKVKASIRFSGREMAHTELGREVLLRFADSLNDCSEIESRPSQEGRVMHMLLVPKIKGDVKNG